MSNGAPRNLLLIVIDQFRADLVSGLLGNHVALPNLRALANRSIVFENHHTVAVPCGPARASLLTGQHVMRHGSNQNGKPFAADTPNLATALRSIGRELLLFGYTDTQPDPRGMHPSDPAHLSYTGPIHGVTEVTEMREEAWGWLAHLRSKGYDVPDAAAPDFDRLYRPQGGIFGGPAIYDAKDSDTAYLTDQVLKHLDVRKANPWSALVTYIRPHPPFVAPAPYHNMVDPLGLPSPAETGVEHPFYDAYRARPSGSGMFWGYEGDHDGITSEQRALCRATYLGLAAEVDHHIGRIFDWLGATGQVDDTMIVLTSDHGEMLGDLGLWGKQNPFRTASHVPLMISHPSCSRQHVTHMSQSIDVAPTVLIAVGAEVPRQMTGQDLLAKGVRHDLPAMVELEIEQLGQRERSDFSSKSPCRVLAYEKDGYRLVFFASDVAPMLFNVETDPYCTVDISRDETERTTTLISEALAYRMRQAF
ncbi:sulfatase-like hydrolase/transferase [Shimia sp. R10_1]|uniref:sulfatase-like hydrolase/transferase n=1 Tax=Shimia sp. R10_1 TaxID=2821095 RepID=UPI001ADC2DBF|nr:sulfatase-like hydrolase/transferase [Shimia sp. R10_1]MBO9475822.1 sulfatase-like hydrolase/transferase [Shimia sp. R10_1]